MPIYLRNSTTAQEVPLGYFVDSTDGNTEETALALGNGDVLLWRTGTTTLLTITAGATHIQNGIYYARMDEPHTGINGSAMLFVHKTGALAVKQELVILPQNTYDSLIAGTDTLQASGDVNIATWAGVTTSASDIAIKATLAAGTHITGTLDVNAAQWAGASTSTNDIALKATLAAGTDITGVMDANAVQWSGASTSTNDIALKATLVAGTDVTGVFDVNAVQWNGISTSTNDIALKATLAAGTDVTGTFDVNITKVNNVTVTGTGAAGNEWGP